MPERHFFALRNTIPGFTFILLIIGINHRPLYRILIMHPGIEFGVFLGFLTLLSGGAIGFLISQVWWFRFQLGVGILRLEEFKGSEKAMLEVYKLKKPQCDKAAQRRYLTVMDYVVHACVDKKVLELAERRWDIYHVLASTICSFFMGGIVGLVGRGYFWVCIEGYDRFFKCEIGSWIVISLFVALFSVMLWKQKHWIITMGAALHEATIRSYRKEQGEIERAFPEFFPKKSQGNTSATV